MAINDGHKRDGFTDEKDTELGFYLASSDRDLLNRVEQIMKQRGVIGLRDALGRIHYVVDGRRGPPFAARRVQEATEQYLVQRQFDDHHALKQQGEAIDEILLGYRFVRTLRGYRFLRHALAIALNDPSTLHPMSKRLFPQAARHFRVSPHQVERNVRYLMDRLAEDEGLVVDGRTPLVSRDGKRLSVTATIYALHDQVLALWRPGDVR